MLLASVGLYFGLIDPTNKDIQALKEQKAEFDKAVDNANQLTERRNALVAKVNSFSLEDSQRLEKLVPDYVDSVRLIMETDRIALKYGMSLRDVQIAGLDTGKPGSASPETSGVIGGVPKDYDSVTMSFSVFTNYQTFKQFLKELEDNLRISDVGRIAFNVPSASKSQEVYQFNVSLKTYWLK